MREYSIAAIPADGIGPEVIAAGLEVLQTLTQKAGGFRLKVEAFPWGSDYYKKHGVMMPQNGLKLLGPFDAVYFGAVGARAVPDHALGPAPGDMPGLRPVCQSSAHAYPARTVIAAARL